MGGNKLRGKLRFYVCYSADVGLRFREASGYPCALKTFNAHRNAKRMYIRETLSTVFT